MRGPHNIWRLIRTGATFERSGAMDVALDAMEAPTSIRIAAKVLVWPFKWLGLKGDPEQPPVLRALVALGPAYIKFGQLMSTRPDVVGQQMADELKVLQDSLPPFSTAEAIAEVERELGIMVSTYFSEFSEPVAAASLAQVHRAVIRETGQAVAVKVLRPGIEKAFMRDVDAFHFAAKVVEAFAPFARRLKPTSVIDHFEGIVRAELDLRTEASAGDEFAANTKNDKGFSVPALIWPLSARRVMTTEWVEGIPLGDVEALLATDLDPVEFSTRIIETFLRHALRDGFFHGDMHQGNLKYTENGDLVAFDFGIMGRIDSNTRRAYAQILFGFLKRDYKRVAEVHFEAGYVPADQDVEEFALAIRAIGEPIFGQDASQISMARLLSQLFDVTERFGMETRTELILLQRTMVVVEGVARTINPDMNMWEGSHTVVETYIRDSLGPKAMGKDLFDTLKVLARFGPLLPQLAETALLQAAAPPPPPRKPRWTNPRSLVLGALVGAAVMWLLR
ncbi:MAG: 2-polyprenylphenol 6-hydroxylase [Rhodobacteraceae bacterium]|nr:2-polyprenylphenol 6-hydroxylase [Paracoccaceae bacterium]